jgi:2-iminobutanoate/2-iminopropanoate deaminase
MKLIGNAYSLYAKRVFALGRSKGYVARRSEGDGCYQTTGRPGAWVVSARKEYRVAGLAEPISHYTDAVQAGEMLFVSGCVPVDRHGRLVGGGDVVAQARQVFTNLGDVLAAAGAGFADVAKVTVYLTDIEDRPRINPVRREVFGDARPASTLVEVSRLAVPGARLEVDAVALVPGS